VKKKDSGVMSDFEFILQAAVFLVYSAGCCFFSLFCRLLFFEFILQAAVF